MDLAKETKARGGLTPQDARVLDSWRKEYALPGHGMGEPHQKPREEHINVGPVKHIPVKPAVAAVVVITVGVVIWAFPPPAPAVAALAL